MTRSLIAVAAIALLIGAVSPAHTAAADSVIVVLAAASLRGPFETMGAEVERAHPGMKVEFSFAGTPTLVQQIDDGAAADVFASADEANMQRVAAAGELAGAPRLFAYNHLAIVVPRGNPKAILSLADLLRPGLTLALAAPSVPAGRYAGEAFHRAGLTPPAASQEADVKAVVTKVALGEADAGIVYVTDARAAGAAVEGIDLPPAHNVVARYPIAVLKAAPNPAGARAFVDFAVSPAGQSILARFGFAGMTDPPPGASEPGATSSPP